MEWIKVEDKMPTERASTDFVLGYDCFYGRIGIAYFNGRRLVLSDSDDCEITHWMPLPEPPKS